MISSLWCEWAWLGGERVEPGVLIGIDGETDRVGGARRPSAPPEGAARRAGVTLPGCRTRTLTCSTERCVGRTHGGKGSFWTWREQMYELAALARSRHAARARASNVRGDGARRHHDRRASSTTCTTTSTAAGTATRTRWGPCSDRGGARRPVCASCSSTRATSKAGSVARSRACSCGSATGACKRGRSESTRSSPGRACMLPPRSTASVRWRLRT